MLHQTMKKKKKLVGKENGLDKISPNGLQTFSKRMMTGEIKTAAKRSPTILDMTEAVFRFTASITVPPLSFWYNLPE